MVGLRNRGRFLVWMGFIPFTRETHLFFQKATYVQNLHVLWARLSAAAAASGRENSRTAVRLSLAAAKSDVKLPELRRLMEAYANQPASQPASD